MRQTCSTGNASLSVMRTLAIIAIFMMSLIALMITPLDNAAHWHAIVIWSKVIAIAGFYSVAKLFQYWKDDKIIGAYLRWCDAPHKTKHGREAGQNGNINK